MEDVKNKATEATDEVQEGMIPLSPRGIAMVETVITAEMLHAYALNQVLEEVPDRADDVRAEIQKVLENTTDFNIVDLRNRVIDSMQTIMSHLAHLSIAAAQAEVKAAVAEEATPEIEV